MNNWITAGVIGIVVVGLVWLIVFYEKKKPTVEEAAPEYWDEEEDHLHEENGPLK